MRDLGPAKCKACLQVLNLYFITCVDCQLRRAKALTAYRMGKRDSLPPPSIPATAEAACIKDPATGEAHLVPVIAVDFFKEPQP